MLTVSSIVFEPYEISTAGDKNQSFKFLALVPNKPFSLDSPIQLSHLFLTSVYTNETCIQV